MQEVIEGANGLRNGLPTENDDDSVESEGTYEVLEYKDLHLKAKSILDDESDEEEDGLIVERRDAKGEREDEMTDSDPEIVFVCRNSEGVEGGKKHETKRRECNNLEWNSNLFWSSLQDMEEPVENKREKKQKVKK